MGLSAGTRLGPCEILAPFGAGGIGEVHQARDMPLRREVAIKVLPDDVADHATAIEDGLATQWKGAAGSFAAYVSRRGP